MRVAGDRPDAKALEEVLVSDEQRSEDKAPEVEKDSEQMEDLELQEQDAEFIKGGKRQPG